MRLSFAIRDLQWVASISFPDDSYCRGIPLQIGDATGCLTKQHFLRSGVGKHNCMARSFSGSPESGTSNLLCGHASRANDAVVVVQAGRLRFELLDLQ